MKAFDSTDFFRKTWLPGRKRNDQLSHLLTNVQPFSLPTLYYISDIYTLIISFSHRQKQNSGNAYQIAASWCLDRSFFVSWLWKKSLCVFLVLVYHNKNKTNLAIILNPPGRKVLVIQIWTYWSLILLIYSVFFTLPNKYCAQIVYGRFKRKKTKTESLFLRRFKSPAVDLCRVFDWWWTKRFKAHSTQNCAVYW